MKQLKEKFIKSIELNKSKDFNEGIKSLNRLDFRDRYGYPTLHIAANLNRKPFVEQLLSNGVNVDIKDKNKNTILLSTVDSLKKSDSKKEELINLLLVHGADPNYKKSKQSYSILHRAIMNYNITAAKLLLEHGALVNENNNVMKFTPLHFAFNLDSVILLMNHKANINTHDKKNSIPIFHHILIGNETKALQMIQEQCKREDIESSNIEKIIRQAIENGKFKIAGFLIQTFYNNSHFHAENFIIEASYLGNSKILKLLLDKILDINVVIEKSTKRTPLHYAVMSNSQRKVKLLLNRGIKIPDFKDKSGKTIFDYAKNKKILALLKKYEET